MQNDGAPERVSAEARSPNSTAHSRDLGRSGRNQNACDACRGRKIKCKHLPGEPRCSGCTFLGIECTRDRPRRRRGPPNRFSNLVQENLISPRINVGSYQTQPSPPILNVSPPSRSLAQPTNSSSPSYAARAVSTPGSGAPETFQLSQLAPIETIRRILDDWFEKIHAVAPILLRRRFLSRLSAGEADTNRTFCALVASVCSATIATLPRGDYGLLTVERCVDFIEERQLLQHSIFRPAYSVDWCIAMYNVGTSILTNMTSNIRNYYAMAEAAAGTRYLLLSSATPASWVDQQLLKRLFWLLYAGTESLDLFGTPGPVLISEQDNIAYLRPQVLTDEQLDPPPPSTPGSTPLVAWAAEEWMHWHGEKTSYVPGLNSLSDLFSIWHESQSRNSHLREQPHHNERRSAEDLIVYYFDKIRQVIDNLPPELRWRGGLSRPRNITYGHDVQIANIFITSFHIRSNILQKYSAKLDINSEASSFCGEEHQRIVDDLLEILYNLPPKVFDANGSSLVPKVRDISAAYLEQIVANKDGDQVGSPTAQEKLEWVLRKVDDLDCWNGLKAIHTMGTVDPIE